MGMCSSLARLLCSLDHLAEGLWEGIYGLYTVLEVKQLLKVLFAEVLQSRVFRILRIIFSSFYWFFLDVKITNSKSSILKSVKASGDCACLGFKVCDVV